MNSVKFDSIEITSAEFVKSAVSLKGLPEGRLPQVGFLGRSNVGKSSLMNALMGQKSLVKVSSTPGKTRELNFFKVNGKFFLVDLPGVGFAKVSIQKRDEMGDFIREYVEKCKDLRGIIYLVDIRHGQTRQGEPVGVCQEHEAHPGTHGAGFETSGRKRPEKDRP